MGEKGWLVFPPSWKLNFIRPLIRIDYTSPPQSRQAALRVPEPILKLSVQLSLQLKCSKKFDYLSIFFYLNKSQKNLLK